MRPPYLFPVSTRTEFISSLPVENCTHLLLEADPYEMDGLQMEFTLIESGPHSAVIGFESVDTRSMPLIRRLSRVSGELLIQRRIDDHSGVLAFALHRAPLVIATWLGFGAVTGSFIMAAAIFTSIWRISLVIIYLAMFIVFNNWLVGKLRRDRRRVLLAAVKIVEGVEV